MHIFLGLVRNVKSAFSCSTTKILPREWSSWTEMHSPPPKKKVQREVFVIIFHRNIYKPEAPRKTVATIYMDASTTLGTVFTTRLPGITDTDYGEKLQDGSMAKR